MLSILMCTRATILAVERWLWLLTPHYCLYESVQFSTCYELEPLRNEQIPDFGNVEAKVLHTRGHTLDSICLLVTDKRRANGP